MNTNRAIRIWEETGLLDEIQRPKWGTLATILQNQKMANDSCENKEFVLHSNAVLVRLFKLFSCDLNSDLRDRVQRLTPTGVVFSPPSREGFQPEELDQLKTYSETLTDQIKPEIEKLMKERREFRLYAVRLNEDNKVVIEHS